MIKCGHCGDYHVTVADVHRCHRGQTVHKCLEPRNPHPCDWWVPGGYHPEDGSEIVLDCGADAYTTDRGFKCVAGHDNVHMWIAAAEGWAYATADEAAGLEKNGVRAVMMDGKPWHG